MGLTTHDKDRMIQLLRLECNHTFNEEVMAAFLDNGTVKELERGQALINAGDITSQPFPADIFCCFRYCQSIMKIVNFSVLRH